MVYSDGILTKSCFIDHTLVGSGIYDTVPDGSSWGHPQSRGPDCQHVTLYGGPLGL